MLMRVAGLTRAATRRSAARDLAVHLGAEDLLIFIRDAEIDRLLPAPGFRPTLPGGGQWQAFVEQCARVRECTGRLPFPTAARVCAAAGLADAEGSVVVLLGGAPRAADLAPLRLMLPLLTAAFRGEQAAFVAAGQAKLARAAAAQAQTLAGALDSTRRELQTALRARDQFLAVAAHELKTPLTVLLGYSEVLLRRSGQETRLTPRERRALTVIAERAHKLHQLIEDLLDVTRIRTGALVLDMRVVDLNSLLTRLLAELQPALDRHHLELHCADLPLPLQGDERRLEQVFQNLLDNAVKYSPAGGVIRVEAAREETGLVVAIADQGIGIPAAAQALVFERFFRAANAERENISGIGVGLFVVQEIIARHGGSVAVRSAEGRGSTFTVRLPASPRAAA